MRISVILTTELTELTKKKINKINIFKLNIYLIVCDRLIIRARRNFFSSYIDVMTDFLICSINTYEYEKK